MNEIRDKTKQRLDDIVAEILRDVSGVDALRYYTDLILSNEHIAIVNREAEVPRYRAGRLSDTWIALERLFYKKAQQDMKRQHWVKEIVE